MHIKVIIYTYMNKYGREDSERFSTLQDALKVIARDFNNGFKTPLSLRENTQFYQQQELLRLCHQFKLL